MNERGSSFKELRGFALSIVGIAMFVLVPVFCLRGVVWVFQHLGQWLLTTASSVSDICAFVLFPLSLFKLTRPFAGLGFLLSSYVFGATLFGLCCAIVFGVWGYSGLIGGLLLGGIGIVPVALLAALVHPASVTFWPLPVGLALTFGTRWLGLRLSRNGSERQQREAQRPVRAHSLDEAMGMASRRILVVHHEHLMAELICTLLLHEGYETRMECSSANAIRIASEFAPHLLIIDPVMPAISGEDAARQISAKTKCKVLLVNPGVREGAFTEFLDDLRNHGCDCEALPTPFESEELLECVRRLVGLSLATRRLS
jgi:CheY-like chemotaxis protein